MPSFLLTSLTSYNEKSPIRKKVTALYHFWGRNNNARNEILYGAKRLGGERESGRNDSGANGKVGETIQCRNDSGQKGKWAKRLRGERESGRNDPDSPWQGLHVRLHEINVFFYIHIPVSTGISLLYANKYIHVYLCVYTSSYCPCMYILISRKWEYVVMVYCVSISVCIFVDNVPTSPGIQNWECIGMVYVSLSLYVYL